MTNPIILKAVSDAQKVLAAYIEPGPRNAVETVDKLIAILDAEKLVQAMQDQQR